VIHSVGPVYMQWSDHPNITAIIYAGAPGEQTGPGLVDVLWGAVNPSGRIPFTIADAEDDYPAPIVYDSDGFPSIDYTEKLLLDYRYMESKGITARFEFGFGLSYTKFEYSNLQISTSGNGVSISAEIQNIGPVSGTEIPQLYLGFPSGTGEPQKVLRGFDDLALSVGERGTVTFKLEQQDLSIWDVTTQSWVGPEGTFSVYVGASIRDIRLQGMF